MPGQGLGSCGSTGILSDELPVAAESLGVKLTLYNESDPKNLVVVP